MSVTRRPDGTFALDLSGRKLNITQREVADLLFALTNLPRLEEPDMPEVEFDPFKDTIKIPDPFAASPPPGYPGRILDRPGTVAQQVHLPEPEGIF